MSHEYRLVFPNVLTARCLMSALRVSEYCVRADQEFVYLKDCVSKTEANYDARLSYDDQNSLWLEVNFRSLALYDLVRTALDNEPYKCLSDGEINEEVALSEAFQLRNLHIPGQEI